MRENPDENGIGGTDMRIDDRRKVSWTNWIFQAIPNVLVVVGAIWYLGTLLGSIDARLGAVQESQIRLSNRLDSQAHILEELTIKVREHDYELELLKGELFYQRPKKNVRINNEAGLPSDYRPQ